MKAVSKIVSLSAFKAANGFSSGLASGKKIASLSTPLENGKGPENKGLQAPNGHPPHPGSGEEIHKATKKKKIAKGKGKKPKFTPTPGPDGFKIDCADMTATQLTIPANAFLARAAKKPFLYYWDVVNQTAE